MSIPEGQRSTGKLAIETEVENLFEYIIDITSNYYIPPESITDTKIMNDRLKTYTNTRWFVERMRSNVLTCLTNVQVANKIKVEDSESYYMRKLYQNQAERSIESVLTIITIMYRKKLIKSKRIKYIGNQIKHIKIMIQNWRKSDKQRYSNLIKI